MAEESRTRRLLRRLRLDRIDFVDRGANPEANIMLFKHEKANPSDRPPISSRQMATKTEPAGGDKEAEVTPTVEELRKEIEAKHADELAELQKQLDAKDEEIAKVVGTDAAELRKALDEHKAEVAELRKAERTRTFVEKAREFVSDDEQAGKLGALLEDADANLSEESAETLAKILKGAKAASEQADKGALFKQLSDPEGEADEGWEDRLEKAAKERVEKSEGSLTLEQAKVKIMEENEDLRREYRESRS